jgi:hypothetical protein
LHHEQGQRSLMHPASSNDRPYEAVISSISER